jgi:DNA-binding transcriptional LysR family regulator
MALDLCQDGIGVTVVPEIAARERLKEGSLAVVADLPYEMNLTNYIVWNKNIYMSPIANRFIYELEKIVSVPHQLV